MTQEQVIAQLERKGFRIVSRLSYGAVVMRKRTSSFGWTQAEVEEDGSVNGMSLDEYLKQNGIRASVDNQMIASELVKIAKSLTAGPADVNHILQELDSMSHLGLLLNAKADARIRGLKYERAARNPALDKYGSAQVQEAGNIVRELNALIDRMESL